MYHEQNSLNMLYISIRCVLRDYLCCLFCVLHKQQRKIWL